MSDREGRVNKGWDVEILYNLLKMAKVLLITTSESLQDFYNGHVFLRLHLLRFLRPIFFLQYFFQYPRIHSRHASVIGAINQCESLFISIHIPYFTCFLSFLR